MSPHFCLCSTTDVHTVASLLKLYLRELPEPVIPYAKYEDFLSCATLLSKEEEAVSWCRFCINTCSRPGWCFLSSIWKSLPPPHPHPWVALPCAMWWHHIEISTCSQTPPFDPFWWKMRTQLDKWNQSPCGPRWVTTGLPGASWPREGLMPVA